MREDYLACARAQPWEIYGGGSRWRAGEPHAKRLEKHRDFGYGGRVTAPTGLIREGTHEINLAAVLREQHSIRAGLCLLVNVVIPPVGG